MVLKTRVDEPDLVFKFRIDGFDYTEVAILILKLNALIVVNWPSCLSLS